jgi:hypothetical protein
LLSSELLEVYISFFVSFLLSRTINYAGACISQYRFMLFQLIFIINRSEVTLRSPIRNAF